MAFVMARFHEKGTGFFLQKITKRTLLIFGIGLFLNWCPFIQWKDDHLIFKAWENVRIFGVLQRIAICYFFASVIVYFFRLKGSLLISGIILLAYWTICFAAGSKGDPYSLAGYFGTAADKAILGANHMYKGEGSAFDPEGVASTLPAIVQVIFGYTAGRYIREKGKTWEMLSHLFIAAALLIFVGFCWDMVFPINKKIWTSSYVLYTTGLALMTIGVMIYLVEFRSDKGAWSRFFNVFGKNPLFIFFLSGFLPRVIALIRWTDHLDETGKRVYTSPLPWFYQHICQPVFSSLKNSSLLYAVCMVSFFWLIAYILDRKRIYIKV